MRTTLSKRIIIEQKNIPKREMRCHLTQEESNTSSSGHFIFFIFIFCSGHFKAKVNLTNMTGETDNHPMHVSSFTQLSSGGDF